MTASEAPGMRSTTCCAGARGAGTAIVGGANRTFLVTPGSDSTGRFFPAFSCRSHGSGEIGAEHRRRAVVDGGGVDGGDRCKRSQPGEGGGQEALVYLAYLLPKDASCGPSAEGRDER